MKSQISPIVTEKEETEDSASEISFKTGLIVAALVEAVVLLIVVYALLSR